MKTKLMAAALLAASAAFAADPLADALAATGWTVAELTNALGILEAKYNRETASRQGRQSWHGRLVRQIVDTNAATKVSVYADGTRFTDPFERPADAALPKPVLTNGVPARIAAARQRLAAQRGTVSNVTVRVTAGGAK